ncbi:MAG TPA: DUF4339 domain-containing protein [Thermoanaerobaculia bacterium]|jgi:hypothetical protein
MAAIWFYVDRDQRRGPVTLEELFSALHAVPDPSGVRVWREGLPDWQEAGSVPDLSARLPPSRRSFQPASAASMSVPFEDAEAIARLYRRLVLLVGLQIVLGFFQLPGQMSHFAGSSALALVSSLALIVLFVGTAVTTYKLTAHLGESLPILWAVAMFIPCLNIIVLLVISSKAQGWCRRYGIKVGFFGPTQESIEELRRRVVSSHFE